MLNISLDKPDQAKNCVLSKQAEQSYFKHVKQYRYILLFLGELDIDSNSKPHTKLLKKPPTCPRQPDHFCISGWA
jgi:hypothetical protein